MSDDALARLLAVGFVTVVALAVARAAPRLRARRTEQQRLSLDGIEGGIVFFSDRSCPRCERVRTMLEEAGVVAEEVVFDDDPQVWVGIGVEAVPLVVIRDRSGTVVESIAGVPSRRRLERALRRAGGGE